MYVRHCPTAYVRTCTHSHTRGKWARYPPILEPNPLIWSRVTGRARSSVNEWCSCNRRLKPSIRFRSFVVFVCSQLSRRAVRWALPIELATDTDDQPIKLMSEWEAVCAKTCVACARGRVRSRACVRARVRARDVCECVRECARARARVCVCVCACVRLCVWGSGYDRSKRRRNHGLCFVCRTSCWFLVRALRDPRSDNLQSRPPSHAHPQSSKKVRSSNRTSLKQRPRVCTSRATPNIHARRTPLQHAVLSLTACCTLDTNIRFWMAKRPVGASVVDEEETAECKASGEALPAIHLPQEISGGMTRSCTATNVE